MLDNDTLQVDAIRKIKVCLSMETLSPVEAGLFYALCFRLFVQQLLLYSLQGDELTFDLYLFSI